MTEREILPPWERKCWGSVWHCFVTGDVAVSHLRLDAGFRCSRHWHADRTNHFYVLSGLVAIEQWPDGPDGQPHETILAPGQHAAVGVGVIHRFVVLEPGEMVEVYRPAHEHLLVRVDDIVRLDEGGPVQ